MSNSTCSNDNTFGPLVRGCRNNSDFTLVFERIILSILPSAIFMVLSVLRIVYLRKCSIKLEGRVFRNIKGFFILLYGVLQFALLVVTCLNHSEAGRWSITASALTCLDAFLLLGLSILEHSRSLRPSLLLSAYLFFSTLFDAAQLRSGWLNKSQIRGSAVQLFTVSFILKTSILVLESLEKSRFVISARHMEYSPEEMGGLFNISLYFWLNALLNQGRRKLLCIPDLYRLNVVLSAAVVQPVFEEEWANTAGVRRHRLLWTLTRAWRWQLLATTLPRIALIGFSFCQPFLISAITNYLQSKSKSRSLEYGYIGACACIYFGIAISTGIYWYLHSRFLARVRTSLVSAIFTATAKLPINMSDNASANTLMSTDVERVHNGLRDFHEIWANAVEVSLACWLLKRQLGLAFLAPIVVVILCILASVIIGRINSPRHGTWLAAIQRRISVTTSAISNMISIKMSGLDVPISTLIQGLRNRELQAASAFRYLTIVATTSAFVPLLISPVITFAVSPVAFSTARIFVSIAYLQLLSTPLTQLFQSIPQVVAATACIERIEKYISLPKTNGRNWTIESQGVRPRESSDTALSLNGRFGWVKDKFLLEVNVGFPRSQLTIVMGPVGCGKSTLCHSLLGETAIAEGEIDVDLRIIKIGYCAQIPFLRNGTIRSNIIGDLSFDEKWYDCVVEAVTLRRDFATFLNGDQTTIDTNGSVLSGGQKQRIALARAFYSRPDLLILDDVFAGLDSETEDHIFKESFGPQGLTHYWSPTTILSTNSSKNVTQASHVVVLAENGTVLEQGRPSALLNQKYQSSAKDISKSTQPGFADILSKETSEGPTPAFRPKEKDHLRPNENKSWYSDYFRLLGISNWAPILLLASGFGFAFNYSNVWLNFWASALPNSASSHSNAYYLGIYSLLRVLALFILALYLRQTFIVIVIKVGLKLHQQTLDTVMNGPLSFFSTTDDGETINRFSQDIGIIDGELVYGLSNLALTSFIALGQAAVIATVSPYLIIGYPVLFVILYCLQNVYLRTSRQLRLLELEAKAPLYTHFLETFTGIVTIRAYGMTEEYSKKHQHLLDESQRPVYLLTMLQQWLALVLNIIVAIVAVLLVTLATQLRAQAGFVGVGLISLMLFGEMLSSIVRCWVQVETALGAIGRLKTFNENLKSENLPEEVEAPENWPSGGAIHLNNVSATYDTSVTLTSHEKQRDCVLRNINLCVEAGQKVGICGRTGSGKSSLLSLILRLLDPLHDPESIFTIDDISVRTIRRSFVRKNIHAVPQSPFFLPDGISFKQSLDPSEETTAEQCEEVLKSMRLWPYVVANGGIQGIMKTETLSSGQLQLFGVARVILKGRAMRQHNQAPGGILVIDEVSSKVDRETEILMMQVLMQEFAAYTVIAVAHRLETIRDFDKVVVMESGGIVEDGHPSELLRKADGRFRSMLRI